MPFFQEDLEPTDPPGEPPGTASPPEPFLQHRASHYSAQSLARSFSEDSVSTELCDGPIPEDLRPRTPDEDESAPCSDRSELIERLKRGESPTWIPNRHFDSIRNQRPATPSRSPKPPGGSPSLLPPPTITPEKREAESEDERRLREGLNIERPRSALHSGDFTQDESRKGASRIDTGVYDPPQSPAEPTSRSWLATSPPRDFTPFQFDRRQSSLGRTEESRLGISSLSSSLSSSFVYQAPTSPLVQSESNDDLDLPSPMEGIDISSSMPRGSRRHTLMSSHSVSYAFPSPSPASRHPLRHERTYPYQAHQPRRSLTSTPSFPLAGTSPQTPAYLRSRRPSYSSDTSPLHHASMVGSYEESILRGRMSTNPSKPLDFVAQIGVLGMGKCKSSLRCPPHVTLPFPAVFYSYASSAHGRSKSEDGPSPYVGQIDLENGLPNQEEEARSKRKTHNRNSERKPVDQMGDVNDINAERTSRDARKSQKQKRRSGSPRAPPGGSYRIPEKGQIQIIIKNPNKTAVKLFLVPYDLTGMDAGTKTFVRQRSYSAGPIIDNLPVTKDTGGADRPILRYLVHLHICCPSRGRYYLYKSIRVVFANRVPDGKEKLQNEITLPEPRFTSYKPIRVMHPPMSAGTGPGANLAAEKAFRRRSSGFYFGASSQAFDATDGLGSETTTSQQPFSFSFSGAQNPVDVIPLRLPQKQRSTEFGSGRALVQADIWSPSSSQLSRPTTQASSNLSSLVGQDSQFDRYDKLSKGDAGYGGNAFSSLINGSPGTAEGLLSQRLRTLGVESQRTPESDQMQE
ncbi:hypothetical protein JX266_004785 [Neoarthrinium moseri]|nr:hypothetical protein JX266_004785 [Neoarthrinium moseri]